MGHPGRGEIAIHAGTRWDKEGAFDPLVIDAVTSHPAIAGLDPPLNAERAPATGRTQLLLPDERVFVMGAIVAVADLVDVTRGASSPWAQSGKVHWLLANVRPLGEPVACRGWQNVWEVPPEVEAAVRAQLERPGTLWSTGG